MRELICAIAIVTLVCFIGSGLEAAATADRLERALGCDVSPVDVWLLLDAAAVVQRLEDSTRMQGDQAEGLEAARLMKEQAALKLADAEQ